MTKPKKKSKRYLKFSIEKIIGYNLACKDWEEYLPTEEQIRLEIKKVLEYNSEVHRQMIMGICKDTNQIDLAKKIYERIQ